MNNRLNQLIILAIIAIPLALLMGQLAATDAASSIALGLAVAAAAMILVFGRNIWLLVPFFLPFTAALRVVPGGFALRDVVIGFVVMVMFGHVATRRVRIRISFGIVEWVLLAIGIFVVQAYMRNPVGVAATGSNMVGGRPYFEMAVSVACFFLLSTIQMPARLVNVAAGTSIAGGFASAVLATITFSIPAVGNQIARVYAIVGTGVFGVGGNAGGGLMRLPYMREFVRPTTTWLLARHSPLQLFSPNRPMVVLVTLFTMAAALLSGYRAMVLWMGLMVVAACLIRRRYLDLMAMILGGVMLMGVMMIGQGNVFKLPVVLQRGLSFLPGAWDSRVKQDAEASTEWRLVMWRLALTTDRYIQNKLLGDGFGVSRHEMLSQIEMWKSGRRTDEAEQDFYMKSGGYHSGPVESIRRVGYIGLFFLLVCQILMARFAWQMINRTRGSPYFFAAMVFGLPLIVQPAEFIFIFGTFKESVTLICINGGFLRMLLNALSQETAELAEPAETVPKGNGLSLGVPAGQGAT